MSGVINITSLKIQSYLERSSKALSRATTQLSTGSRILSASDDAAGLALSDKITALVAGNTRAKSNAQAGSNLLTTAEGNMGVVSDNLQRIKDLCTQAPTGTYSDEQKQTMYTEIEQRLAEIDSLAETSEFNGVKLLNGSNTKLYLQIGSGSNTENNSIDIAPALSNVHTSTGGLDIKLPDVWNSENIRQYMDKVDTALGKITSGRSLIGAYGNRLEAATENLVTNNTSLDDAKATVADVDIATTSSEYIKNQIMQETASSILVQANQMQGMALTLLKV